MLCIQPVSIVWLFLIAFLLLLLPVAYENSVSAEGTAMVGKSIFGLASSGGLYRHVPYPPDCPHSGCPVATRGSGFLANP